MPGYSRMAGAGLLGLSLCGCANIKYAVTDQSTPVAFSGSADRTVDRYVKTESRSFFGAYQFVTYNQFAPFLGNGLQGLTSQAGSGAKLKNVRIVEEFTLLDVGISILIGGLGGVLANTFGTTTTTTVSGVSVPITTPNYAVSSLIGILFNGTRTSTIEAEVGR